MSWLITGANGYIGRHVVEQLKVTSTPLLGIDLCEQPKYEINEQKVQYGLVDIRDKIALKRLFTNKKIDGIVHLAGLKSVTDSFNYPSTYYETNVESTGNLLLLCSKYEVKRFIFASSAAVYGNIVSGIAKENSILSPASPYGRSKMLAEKLLGEYPEVDSIALRFFNVVGAVRPELAEHKGSNLVTMILQSLKNGSKVDIFGNNFKTFDGTAERDYVDVVDVAKVIKQLITMKEWDSNVKVLNVGSGKSNSVMQVIEVIQSIFNVKTEYEIQEKRKGDVGCLVADISLLQNYLKFEPSRNLSYILENITYHS